MDVLYACSAVFLLNMGLPLWFAHSFSNAVEMRLPNFCARPEKAMQFQCESLGAPAPWVLFEGVPSQKPHLIAGKCHVVHLSLSPPGSGFQNHFIWGGSCVSQRPPDDCTSSKLRLQASRDRDKDLPWYPTWILDLRASVGCCFILLSSARAVI